MKMTRDEFFLYEPENLQLMMKIKFNGFIEERGIAIRLGCNLSGDYQSDDDIVFWDNGDHTILPDEFEVLEVIEFD